MRHLRTCFYRQGLIALFLLVACGEDEAPTGVPEPTAEGRTAVAWSEFEKGDPEKAYDLFAEALRLDPEYVPAIVGSAWSSLARATATDGLEISLNHFDDALSRSPSDIEALAGRAAALLALDADSLDAADAAAQIALDQDPEFVFSHRPTFNSNDLLLIGAFSRVSRGDYQGGLAAADQIAPSGIREFDEATWVVNGILEPTFQDAVLSLLQKLSEDEAG